MARSFQQHHHLHHRHLHHNHNHDRNDNSGVQHHSANANHSVHATITAVSEPAAAVSSSLRPRPRRASPPTPPAAPSAHPQPVPPQRAPSRQHLPSSSSLPISARAAISGSSASLSSAEPEPLLSLPPGRPNKESAVTITVREARSVLPTDLDLPNEQLPLRQADANRPLPAHLAAARPAAKPPKAWETVSSVPPVREKEMAAHAQPHPQPAPPQLPPTPSQSSLPDRRDLEYWISLVRTSLDSHMYSNAIFLVERIIATAGTFPSLRSESSSLRHLLADCYLRASNPLACLHTLTPADFPNAGFLYAKAAMELGRWAEAETALLKMVSSYADHPEPAHDRQPPVSNNPDIVAREWPWIPALPPPGFVHHLLGIVYRNTGRSELAKTQFLEALKCDPLLWSAYEELCSLGPSQARAVDFVFTETPGKQSRPTTEANSMQGEPRRPKAEAPSLSRQNSASETESKSSKVTHTKKKARIAPPTKGAQTEQERRGTQTPQQAQTSAPAGPHPAFTHPLIQAGTAWKHFCAFEFNATIKIIEEFPSEQFHTGWAQSVLGRSLFEICEYKRAEVSLKRVRTLEPFRVTHMDVYSSALWHLKKDVTLSYLGHELVAQHPRSPETWCVVGNCFSLKNEHDSAIKCYTRALQLDPSNFYASTLMAHEYASMDDYDKAMLYFRNALRLNSQNHTGWYGIGFVYFRQEKFELAEFHFKKALAIHSENPVIIIYLGLAAERQNRLAAAVSMYEKANAMCPNQGLCRFRLCNALYMLGRLQEALALLSDMDETVETNVPVLRGRILAKLGDRQAALREFATAHDLNAGSRRQVASLRDEINGLLAE
ncbi:hypothetical protein DFJ73DRAFT_320321 [Zopfochytrium polystomum]|nr:hypothetical protein DFJ73DRAFT_320321 [Zopfochytrium polystomum]